MAALVIGVDPGQTTGLCALTVDGTGHQGELMQCTRGLVLPTVRALLGVYEGNGVPRALVAVERFVVGPRASRSSSAQAGRITRELIGALVDLGAAYSVRVVQRAAAEVKPWATDERLDRAGLRVRGMPHAADAARHALFAAVRDCGLPDPLSRTSRPHRSPR